MSSFTIHLNRRVLRFGKEQVHEGRRGPGPGRSQLYFLLWLPPLDFLLNPVLNKYRHSLCTLHSYVTILTLKSGHYDGNYVLIKMRKRFCQYMFKGDYCVKTVSRIIWSDLKGFFEAHDPLTRIHCFSYFQKNSWNESQGIPCWILKNGEGPFFVFLCIC